MALSLQRLLERSILPNAHQTDANHWRQLLQRPDIRHVLTKFVPRRPYNSFAAHRWLCAGSRIAFKRSIDTLPKQTAVC